MTISLSKASSVDFALHTLKTWWWVIFIAVGTAIIYEQGFVLLQQEKSVLAAKLHSLEEKRSVAIKKQHILLEEIASHNDASWLELVLRKELGLVPAGYQKIYFK